MKRWLFPTLLVLAVLVLFWLCIRHHAPRIQTEVTASASRVLEDTGFERGLLAVDGRDVILSGVVVSDGDRQRALDAVASARGVRRVVDLLESPPEPDRVATASEPSEPELGEPGPEVQAQPLEEALATIDFERVEFGRDSAELTAGAEPVLDQLARLLAARPDARIAIVGHTDNRASAEHNADLSRRRAAAVRDYLVARGLSTDRFETRGAGEDEPIADNETAEDRRRNRRVEFHLIGEAQ